MADKKVRYINLNNQILTLGGDGILSFPDIATMASEPIASLQNGAIGWVDSEQKYFQWLDTNEISEMGYWKELIFGSDFQISVPTTSADDDRYKGKVIQYVGEDDLTTGFKKGYFYESRLSNTINYVETVCTETSTGTYYILRDGEYLEVVLLGDGTTFDPDETYYKKQEVNLYGWYYINALRVDTTLADTDYAIANKTVKAKFDEVIQDYTDKNDALREYVDNDLTTALQQYADDKINDEDEVAEDKVWSNSKTKDYIDTALENYTTSAIEILQADFDALDEETKLANNYNCTDTGRIYCKGILYGGKEPIYLTLEEYKTLETEGKVESDQDYIIVSNDSGTLLTSTDVAYSDTLTVKGKLDDVEKEIIEFTPKNNIKVNTTRMIAHRGRSDIAPENTIPAYELAADFGYWGGEVDLQKTSDGYFICLHDGSVDRTTNGIGSVSNLTLAEIQSLHIKEQTPFMGSAELSTLPYGEAAIKVPTLEEYLNVCKQYNIVPVIELKEETIKATDIAAILDVVNKWEMAGQVVFIAFNDYNTDLLETIHSINSTIMCQPIMDFTRENIDYVANNFSPNCGIDPIYSQVTKELVEYAHSKGVEVNCWTCDDEIDKERLMSYGVDYITTNKLINSNLPEMKIGALGYELGGFDRVVDVLQKSFEMHSELYPNLVYCQNPVLGNHNNWDAQTIEQRDSGTTPYERAILTSSSSAELVSSFTKRALDKTKYYVNEKTVYVSGLDFTKYKVTLLPFNEKGLFITDLGWITNYSYVTLPDRTQFVLFYFGKVDGSDITNEDLENMKQAYFCKTQRRRYVKLDSDFVFVTKLNDNLTSLGKTSLQLSEMTSGLVSGTPTNRAWCFKGLNVKDYLKAKVHYLNENYDVTIYAFVRDRQGKLVYQKDLGWAEDGVEITLTSGAERIYFAFRRKDNATMSQKDFINVSNSVMVEVC